MSESLLPQTPKKRAPTYAIALLPFVLVLLISLVAHVGAALRPAPSVDHGDGGAGAAD